MSHYPQEESARIAPRHQIRIKVFLAITLVMGALTTIYCSIDLYRENQSLKKGIITRLKANQKAVIANTNRQMASFSNDLHRESVTNPLIFSQAIPPRYKSVWMRYIVSEEGLIKEVVLMNATNKMFQSSKEIGKPIQDFYTRSNYWAAGSVWAHQNLRLYDWLSRWLKAQESYPAVSGIVKNKDLGGPTIFSAHKVIHGQNQLTGYLVGMLDLDFLSKQIKLTSPFSEAAFVLKDNENQEITVHKEGSFGPEVLVAGVALGQGVMETLSPYDKGQFVLRETITFKKPFQHLTGEMISYLPSLPTAIQFNDYRKRLFTNALLLWAAVMILAWFFAVRFSNNLREISKIAYRIAKGESLEVPRKSGKDEIARLYQAVDTMNHQLQERQQAMQKARNRLKYELDSAARIQRDLLPPPVERVGIYEISSSLRNAMEASGDMVGSYRTLDGSLAVTCGDISGKGAGAAVYMALLNGLIAAELTKPGGPAQVMDRLNRALLDRASRTDLYATLALGIFYQDGTLFRFSSAGHPYPFIYNSRHHSWKKLDATGTPLGLEEKASFGDYQELLGPGDIVVFYSDGLTEAVNDKGEFLGDERLLEFLNHHKPKSAEETIAILTGFFNEWLGNQSLKDDMAVVAVCRETLDLLDEESEHILLDDSVKLDKNSD